MSDSPKVFFRFLSGSNIGAEFALPPGKYVLGNDEDCDIQINEKGERLKLKLFINDDLSVEVSSFLGKSFYAGKILGEDPIRFEPGQIVALGFSSLTHLSQGARAPSIDLAALGFGVEQHKSNNAPLPEDGNLQNLDDAAVSHSDKGALLGEQKSSESAQDPTAQSNIIAGSVKSGGISRWSLYFLTVVGLLLVGFALSSLIAGSALYGERAERQEALKKAQDYLYDQGYMHVGAAFDHDLIVFSGFVESQSQYAKFVRSLPPLPFGTALSLQIKDSLLLSIEKSCAVRGASVSATYADPLAEDKSKIILKGYVRDPYVETALIKNLTSELKVGNLQPAFVYEEGMRKLIDRFLPTQLQKLPLSYDRFKIYYHGDLTLEELNLLSDLRTHIGNEIGAKLVLDSDKNKDRSQIEQFNFTNDELNLATTHKKNNKAEDEQKSAVTAFGLNDIIGVTMQPLRFVSMRDGSRYFEGSVLPDGSVLKSISVHSLLFERNGEVSSYELK